MLFRRRHAPSLTSSNASSAASDDSVLSPDALGYDSSDSDYYDDDERRIRERRRREQLQQEWEEGMEQLQLIFVVVLMPWVGKFWGRKFAHTRKFLFHPINFMGFMICHLTDRLILCHVIVWDLHSLQISLHILEWFYYNVVHARYLRVGLGRTFFFL
jgi:hypothetical protein